MPDVTSVINADQQSDKLFSWDNTVETTDIDDDESAFNISQFFANRIISESSDNSPKNFVMVNGNDSDKEGEEYNEEEIPDLIEIVEGYENWHRATSLEVLSPITLAHMDECATMEQDFIHGNTHCSECGECRPRIVADYHVPRNPPGVTRHLRAICMNSGTNMEVRPGLQDIVLEGTLLPRVPKPHTSTEAAIEDHTDSEDEEWREHMAHHHHTPPECPYCHNCRPIIEEIYYMATDGEVFYRDRLVCQSDTTTTEASGSNTRLQAMRTVYSSNATLSAEIEINGVRALALFDTGSTTDSITPEFTFTTKVKTFKLDEQVPIGFSGIKDKVYFDLVNIDRYDCIIGTPFMNTHKVCLDFGTRTIKINGQVILALSSEDEQRQGDGPVEAQDGPWTPALNVNMTA
ncbi:hypothetical protein PILCRDRAFT_15824 [Piloderma croceum F 1598]|uniref:Uncharacterized protein n=1 Tax=Piloderma croceum (strain F 1598) TaxID=765440 RepID=A0A0C3AG25_PILCF|nr:hypothetical protein PILCRDRAFT_15824 [Piloderma croceum F 1598]